MQSRRRSAILALAVLLVLPSLDLGAQAAPTVSEKQDVAVFALGYFGWNIPLETLGNIDLEIQKVFVDLGRFNVIGVTQRLSSGGLADFIAAIKKAKETNVVLPDKYQFGEAFLTEADWGKLVGAFIVAAPVVSNFSTGWNQKTGYWETEIKTNVTFIDVAAGGTTIAIAEVTTSGSDKDSQVKSISGAIEGIPMQLTYEVRKVPAFQISTRVLAVSGSEIKLQLGRNMGIQRGDEYAVVVGGMVEGFRDDRETGLVVIKDVGAEVSTGRVVYNKGALGKDAQLKEIPRMGIEAVPFLHYVSGVGLDVPLDPKGNDSTIMIGLRVPVARGFYGFRPFAEVEIPLNGIRNVLTAFAIPINGLLGAEYNLYLGRLSLTPYAAVGASYVYLTELVSGSSRDTSDTYIFHFGGQANVAASFLVTRELSVFAEAGLEYWISTTSWLYSNYGGLSLGAGASWKL